MNKILLYIDILGFSNLVNNKKNKLIKDLYNIIDSINAHRHDAFKTLVFSDTILVYNNFEANNEEKKAYSVMYLIEFTKDLQNRLTKLSIFFRALIVEGEFTHKKMENLDAYWGNALIKAYLNEKDIPAVGIFLEKEILKYNRIFSQSSFNDNFNFIFPTQSLDNLESFLNGSHILSGSDIFKDPVFFDDHIDGGGYLIYEVKFLEKIYQLSHGNITEEPRIRIKYLETFRLYKEHYPKIINLLLNNNFTLLISTWTKKLNNYKN